MLSLRLSLHRRPISRQCPRSPVWRLVSDWAGNQAHSCCTLQIKGLAVYAALHLLCTMGFCLVTCSMWQPDHMYTANLRIGSVNSISKRNLRLKESTSFTEWSDQFLTVVGWHSFGQITWWKLSAGSEIYERRLRYVRSNVCVCLWSFTSCSRKCRRQVCTPSLASIEPILDVWQKRRFGRNVWTRPLFYYVKLLTFVLMDWLGNGTAKIKEKHKHIVWMDF